MAYECELVDLQVRPTLVVRTRTTIEQLPTVLGPSWRAVMACAGKSGDVPSDAPFVAYHNWDSKDLDVEIGFNFARPVAGEGDVQAGEIAGGKAAQCIHVGPYDRLRSTYEVLEAWMEDRALQHAGPAYEFYLDDPQDTSPEGLRTRIVLPVR